MLAESLHTLLRRWPLAVLAIVLALAAGVGVYRAVPAGQESKAQILLVPSVRQPGVPGATNPYLGLGDSLGIVATILQVSVSDDQTARKLHQSGYRAEYTVAPNLAENAGPILLVTTNDRSAATAQATLRAVIADMSTELLRLQQDQNVPENLLITAVVLTSSSHALPVHKPQVEKAVIAAAVVFLVLVALILVAERFAAGRRRERGVARAAEETPAEARTDGVDEAASAPPETQRTAAERPRQRRRRNRGHPSPVATDEEDVVEEPTGAGPAQSGSDARVYAGAEQHDR